VNCSGEVDYGEVDYGDFESVEHDEIIHSDCCSEENGNDCSLRCVNVAVKFI